MFLLPTRALDLVAQRRQFRDHLIAVVALNLDRPVFYRTTGAAELFQLLRERAKFAFRANDAINDRNSLAAPVFAVTRYAHDAIALALRFPWSRAATVFVCLPAGGTGIDAAAIG